MNEVTRLIKRSDEGVYYFLNGKLHHQMLCISMILITELGSTAFSVISCILSIYIQLGTGNMIGEYMTVTIIFSQILVQTLKRIVNRPRPYRVLKEANAKNPPKCRYSFPSGHTSAAFCIAFVMYHSLPALSFIVFPLALLVGISRIYLGVHYPTDVLVGGIIAYISFIISCELIIPALGYMQPFYTLCYYIN